MPANQLSNYPQGFSHGVAIHGLPVLNVHHGNVFWVNSATGNDSGAADGSRTKPFATLDYAIGKCTADNGDMIMLAPNHAETITGVGGITADVAGITVIGLGTYNQRARFLMDGADTVDVAVSAADVTFKNIVFASGHADVVRCFNITAAGCTLDSIEFVDNTTNEDWLTPIKGTSTTDGNANGLTVINCRWVSIHASGLEFIELNADVNDFVCQHNYVVTEGTNSPLILCATGKDVKMCDIRWNFLSTKMASGNLFMTNDTASPNNSGIIAHNRVGHADVTGAHELGVVGGCRKFDNLSVSTDALSGFVLPAIDVDL